MTELAALARFVHIAAAVFLAGSFVFIGFVARPAWRLAGVAAGVMESQALAVHRRVALWSTVAVMLSALTGLWLQALAVSASADAQAGVAVGGILPLLAHTLYGNVWLLRMALALAMLVLLLHGLRSGQGARDGGRAGLLLGAALLGSVGLAGHAAAGEGVEFLLHSLADIFHLLAAGAWLGALPPLFLALRTYTGSDAQAPVVREITHRFSMLGLACVSTLLVTGAINTWILVGGVPQLLGTAYGHLLLLKLSLLLPMLCIAAVNLMKINPQIMAEPQARTGTLAGHAAMLSRNALIEALLGLAILAIVGYLGSTPPARHVQPDWPFPFRWDWASLDAAPRARAEVEVGLAWGVLGLFVLQFAFLTRRYRMVSATLGSALLAYATLLVLTNVTTDAYPDTYRRPAVAYNAISVANGKALYEKNCVACHGTRGYGDGPAAEGLQPRPADLAGRHANAHTVGDLFWWVSKGIPKTAMQGFESRLGEDERWDLINLVRALASAKRARSLAPVIEDRPWLVAPDFAYATGNAEPRTLKDHRGGRLVLLVIAEGPQSAVRLQRLAASVAVLAAAGVELIAVPGAPGMAGRGLGLPLVTEGGGEIRETYRLFAEGFSDESAAYLPRHVEYLIDRQGYIRARWLPAESEAWSNPGAILEQAQLLLKEIPRAPAPEEHVH